MPTFFSPAGNPEVWAEMPSGYYTVDEWNIAHPAPEPTPLTPEQEKEIRKQEIYAELDNIDRASSRSLRAILTAQSQNKEPDSADIQKLSGYESQAKELRKELSELA